MPKSYSSDLRERVIEAVESGASRRGAGERFVISASSSIRWLQRWQESGSAAPKPRGGSVSPLEAVATQVLAVIAERPDLTLVETVAELRKQRIRTSRSSLWRFLVRHGITLKKKPASRGTAASRRGPSAPALDPRARPARLHPAGVHR
jgi:transposase